MNTIAHLVARALRDHKTIANADNALGHRIRIHAPRATILRLVRQGVIVKPVLYAATHGLDLYRIEPPPPTPEELEAKRLELGATIARKKRELCIHRLEQAHELLSGTGDIFDQAAAAEVLHTVTQLNAKIDKTTLR